MAKHVRRRSKGKRTSFEPADGVELAASSSREDSIDEAFGEEGHEPTDWFGPEEPEELERYVPRRDVPLAAMLMVAAQPWQRIDGMGLARKALEADATGDERRDLSEQERFLLANGRTWCLLVHGDLGHDGRLDDPIVLADARRHLEVAQLTDPANPAVLTTLALLWIREGDATAGLQTARHAVEEFAGIPDERRSGQTQAAAILALVTLGLAYASSGDPESAVTLAAAARAVGSPLDLDEAAFTALLGEITRLT